MKQPFTGYGNDLYCKFECNCLDPRWKDSNVSHLFKTKITLYGYNDSNFFDVVNKEANEIKCNCGESYMVQWFRDGVEITNKKEIKLCV